MLDMYECLAPNTVARLRSEIERHELEERARQHRAAKLWVLVFAYGTIGIVLGWQLLLCTFFIHLALDGAYHYRRKLWPTFGRHKQR